MARQWFDKSDWDAFWRFWDDAIQRIPDLKREALEAMGKAVLQEVREQISRRGVHDSQGRVAKWQEMRIGSKGGYVAVSPSPDETVQVTRSGETTTSKDVTRYLERGHGIPETATINPASPATGHTSRDGCFTAGRRWMPRRLPWRKLTGPWIS